jgi:hypothetical protein
MFKQEMFDGEVDIGIARERLIDLVKGGRARSELSELVGGERGIEPGEEATTALPIAGSFPA